MIKSLQEAFHTLDTQRYGIPNEAIEFLYDHEPSEIILEKIIFALENAYNDRTYYNKKDDFYYNTPLWYAIVAEKHPSEKLIEPIFKLFEDAELNEWELLSRQGVYLLQALCNHYQYIIVLKTLHKIKHLAEAGSNVPYYWLYNMLKFANMERHHDIVMDILKQPLLQSPEIFVDFLTILFPTELAIPVIKSRLSKLERNQLTPDEEKYITSETQERFERALWQLEKGLRILSVASEIPLINYYIRGDWKTYYKNKEDLFLE